MHEQKGPSADETAAQSLPPPSPSEVRDQLARILGSPEFAVPERGRAFLRYLVEQTLAGRAQELKGYTIGTAVFNRGASFDPQADPVVRMEAGRLRRALERYYLVAGRDDPVLFEVPKGGYAPIFSQRAVSESQSEERQAPIQLSPAGPVRSIAATAVLALVGLTTVLGSQQMRPDARPSGVAEPTLPANPTVLVMPFASLGGGDEATLYAAGVTEEILTKLSHFKDLAVVGGKSVRTLAPDAAPQSSEPELPARYTVTGSLRLSGPEMRVTSRLIDTGTDTVLWAQIYEENLGAKELFAIQEDIAHQVVTAIAQPYGVVFRSELQRTAGQPPDDLEAYACTLRFYVYRAKPSPDSHALVRGCLERALARFPGYATAWAMFSALELDEDRFAFNRQPGEPGPIERALHSARRAVELDAENARGLQALMMALFFHGEVDEAERVGELALAANPQDTELLGEFGLRIALAGQWQRGRELAERALARDPAYSGYCHSVLALIAYMQRDDDRAEAEIRQADLTKFSLYHAIAAVIYAERGLVTEAQREAALFTELHPSFVANIDSELRKRNLRPEDQARLVRGLLKAGVPIPPEAATAATWLSGPS